MYTTLFIIFAVIVIIACTAAMVKVARIDSNPNKQRFESVDRQVYVKTQNGWIRK